MLTYLHVKNLALIDEAEVEFGPGLNIGGTDFSGRQSKMCGTIEREGNLCGRRADYYIQKTYREPEYQQVKR